MSDSNNLPEKPQSLDELLKSLEEPEHKAEVVLKPSQQGMANIRRIEENLLRESMKVVSDAVSFREIDADSTEPPPHWLLELGEAEAWRKFRMAKAAWLPQKDSPVGFKIAAAVMSSIIKARATEKQAPRELNIAAQMIFTSPKLPKKIVDEE